MIEYINEEETVGKILKNIKHKLTLQEARQQYRNQNKKCEYCEFCSRERSFEDFGGVIEEFDILWCHVKDEKCDNKPCEFYQVKCD